MPKKTGICINVGGRCPKALSREKQEADVTNFKCEHCGGELREFKGSTGPDWKKIAIIGTAVAALLGGGAYFAFSGSGEKESITLNKTTASVFEGDVDTLKAIVKPEDAGYTLKWASNNPNVATVDNGVVSFHSKGEVKIGVQVNENKELKAFCDYIVDGPDTPDTIIAEWIKIMDGNQTLKVGETKQLSLDCDPGNANEPVEWTSSNPDVVTVEYGKLTAVAPGTAKITATTKIGKIMDNIKVAVKNGEGPGPVNLGYAKYEGDTKNGKPHGNGTMTFKETHVVPGAKGDIEAKAGEYAIGSWRNGEVNLVTLYQKNGNQVKIMHK
ncbi:MAG: hypothetical protein E7095_08035 [Bacteroides sp.]|nr:hypothetical protein [Bacteroides sp.]